MTDSTKNIETELPETVDTPNTNPEIETLKADVAELSDKYLRTAAELENMRRRSILDAENMARSRSVSLLENFLSVADAVDAALKHAPEDAGIIALANAINSAFSKSGITRIKTLGEKLNPIFHSAVSIEDKSGAETNTITTELQSGYMFGDTVLRAAMVIVAK